MTGTGAVSLPTDPGPCPECGEPRRRQVVAGRFVVAVCHTSPDHGVFEEIRPGEPDWTGEDRWWESEGLDRPVPAEGRAR